MSFQLFSISFLAYSIIYCTSLLASDNPDLQQILSPSNRFNFAALPPHGLEKSRVERRPSLVPTGTDIADQENAPPQADQTNMEKLEAFRYQPRPQKRSTQERPPIADAPSAPSQRVKIGSDSDDSNSSDSLHSLVMGAAKVTLERLDDLQSDDSLEPFQAITFVVEQPKSLEQKQELNDITAPFPTAAATAPVIMAALAAHAPLQMPKVKERSTLLQKTYTERLSGHHNLTFECKYNKDRPPFYVTIKQIDQRKWRILRGDFYPEGFERTLNGIVGNFYSHDHESYDAGFERAKAVIKRTLERLGFSVKGGKQQSSIFSFMQH